MSATASDLIFEPRLSTAQRHFVEAVCNVVEKLEIRLYNASCFKADDGKWYCKPGRKSFALYHSLQAVRWDFQDRYPKMWRRSAEALSDMAWDVFFVWRMCRRSLHLPAGESVFWKDVMVEWRHEMNMWLFHSDWYFVDGEDEFTADPCLHPTWNWYTLSPKDEARLARRRLKLQKASEATKSA